MDRSLFLSENFDVIKWINDACMLCPEGDKLEKYALSTLLLPIVLGFKAVSDVLT
jgi:hypothetical protein